MHWPKRYAQGNNWQKCTLRAGWDQTSQSSLWQPVPARLNPSPLRSSLPGKESQRPVAHECLGEVLRVLRQVINTYPLLNTVEILTAAGKLISKVKGQSAVQRGPRPSTQMYGKQM